MSNPYRWLVRDETLLMFDREDTINFSSALQIQRVGDHAQIHSLHGDGFYKLLSRCGTQPFRERKIKYVQAAVSMPHLLLLRRQMRKLGDVTLDDVRACTMESGLVLRWVLMTINDLDSVDSLTVEKV